MLAVTLVAAYLGGVLLGQAHASAVAHVLCNEHGQGLHLGPRPWSLRAAAARPGERARPTQSVVAPHGDHCALGGATAPSAPPRTAASSVAVVTPPRAAPWSCARQFASAQAPLLDLAPKTSPPR
jgi:hypothetical protein